MIQSPQVTQSQTGELQTAWQDFKPAWAKIESISARDFISAQQSQSEITTKIKLRFVPGITSQMRVVFGTRTFEIVAPPMLLTEPDRPLQLLCRELF